MRVSFIGRGNVATNFAERLRRCGVEVVQMCSRSGTPVAELDADAVDAVIVAVSDDAIAPILDQVPDAGSAVWLHTAGSVGIDVFDPEKFPRHGILYPLQTMLKGRETDWGKVPMLVEGDPLAEELARLMSPSVARLDSESRRRLHAAAVICCNMAMYLWSLSEELTTRAGLSFDMLRPLIDLTAARALEMSPAQAMTGPAKRGDLLTMRKHLNALPADIADVYRFISNKMLQQFHPEIQL
ncbi:MAG: DUF2520 domain-containing protein [Muribaculaceae bacterium]|nr:DUF2520 domain-containing protein [Muribaculaceae bacterium]